MDTGRKILNLRKDIGLPQKILAKQTSVTPSALSRIEAGIHQPRGLVALRIARELGVTVDYLLDEDAPYPPPPWELLANLRREPDPDETPSETVSVTPREKAMLEALRHIDSERQSLIERALDCRRQEVRQALFVLGGLSEEDGDPAELAALSDRVRALRGDAASS